MDNSCQIGLRISNAGGAVLIKLQADARTVNVISNAGVESNGDWSLNTTFFQKAGCDVPSGQTRIRSIEDIAAAIVWILLQLKAIVLDHVVIRKAS